MNYSSIWREFSDRFYTQPLLGLIELIAILIGIKYCSKEKIGKLLISYIAFDFIILLTGWSLIDNNHFTKTNTSDFFRITNTLIAIFEINIYYLYFKLVIKPKKYKLFFTITPILYTLIALIQRIFLIQIVNHRINYTSYLLYTLELVLILPPLILYFFQLIKYNSDIPLLSRPSFWISVGIFFQSIISIPCYLIISHLLRQKTEYMPFIEATLYYTPLIINITFITKAFLCKKTLTI